MRIPRVKQCQELCGFLLANPAELSSHITETSAVRDTAEPTPNGKAHFPSGGKDLQCPHCKTESTYRLSDLKYHFQLD